MTKRILAAAVVIIALLALSPQIAGGINDLKTFLSMRVLLNPCDGAGSPPPCKASHTNP